MGPSDANDVGKLKMPTPMMLPMMSAIATLRPKRWSGVAVAVSELVAVLTGAPAPRPGVT